MGDERLAFLDRVESGHQRLLDRNEGDPGSWPLHEKVRLAALFLDLYDLDRGVYDRTELQDDLREAAIIVEGHSG